MVTCGIAHILECGRTANSSSSRLAADIFRRGMCDQPVVRRRVGGESVPVIWLDEPTHVSLFTWNTTWSLVPSGIGESVLAQPAQ